MPKAELVTQLKTLAEDATAKADHYSGVISSVQDFILQNFGQNGLYAAYIVTAALILFVVSRLAKLTFSAVKYLILPAIALAFLGSLVAPLSFLVLLPITVTACSLVLLFKG